MASNTKSEEGVVTPTVSAKELKAAMEEQSRVEANSLQLIAITMKQYSKVQVPVARGFKYVSVEPLGITPPIPADYAKRITQPKRINNKNVRPALVWHIRPEVQPKGYKKQSFQTQNGMTFGTNTYAPEEGLEIYGRKIYHSVSQAQHFIAKVLRTKEGIHRFITEFDTRPDVASYGNYMISEKDREEREMLGVTTRTLVTV